MAAVAVSSTNNFVSFPLVESLSRFATKQPLRAEVLKHSDCFRLLKCRVLRVFLDPSLDHCKNHVITNVIGQRQGTHRLTGPQLHGGVDVLHGSIPACVHGNALDKRWYKQPVHDKTWCISTRDCCLACFLYKCGDGFDCRSVHAVCLHDFHQPHHLYRIKIVNTNNSLRDSRCFCNIRDAETTCVGRKNAAISRMFPQRFKQWQFDSQVFHNSFDNQISRLSGCIDSDLPIESTQYCFDFLRTFCFSDFSFCHFLSREKLNGLLDGAQALRQGLLRRFTCDHVVTTLCTQLCNTMSHRSESNNADGLNVIFRKCCS
eukprot:m.131704 g.131704  ORF g.131704 m.131704 type:complete len:317 (+) comp17479_c0_seq1:338-1288(+)